MDGVQLLTVSRPELVPLFTGLTVAQFDRLVDAAYLLLPDQYVVLPARAAVQNQAGRGAWIIDRLGPHLALEMLA